MGHVQGQPPAQHPHLRAPEDGALPTAAGLLRVLCRPPWGAHCPGPRLTLGACGRRCLAGPQVGGNWTREECLYQGKWQMLQTRPGPASCQPFPQALLPADSSIRDRGRSRSLSKISQPVENQPQVARLQTTLLPLNQTNVQINNHLGVDGRQRKTGGPLLGPGAGGLYDHKQVGLEWVVPIPFLLGFLQGRHPTPHPRAPDLPRARRSSPPCPRRGSQPAQ